MENNVVIEKAIYNKECKCTRPRARRGGLTT
jgi:hypothetical protein